MYIKIKTNDNELLGQEEAACMHAHPQAYMTTTMNYLHELQL